MGALGLLGLEYKYVEVAVLEGASTSLASCTPPVPRRDHRLTSASTSTLGLSTREWGTVCTLYFGKTKTIPQEKIDSLKEALMWANQMTACGYVLGNSMTIADVDFMATYSTLEACNFINLAPY